MPRGNGKQAQEAVKVGKLSAFVKAKGEAAAERSPAHYVSWNDVNPDLLVGAIWAVNKEGGALLLGHSRDKSSYSVKVYAEGEGTAYYFRYTDDGIAELENFLRALCEVAEGDR